MMIFDRGLLFWATLYIRTLYDDYATMRCNGWTDLQ